MKYTLKGKFGEDIDKEFTGALFEGTVEDGTLDFKSFHSEEFIDDMINLQSVIGSGELVIKYDESPDYAKKAEDFYGKFFAFRGTEEEWNQRMLDFEKGE